MDTQELKKKLVKMRDAITDYLDNLDMDMDEVDKKPEKKPEPKGEDKKPEKGKPDVEEDKEEED